MPFDIATVDALTDAAYQTAFGDIAEHSAWVAEGASSRRPHGSREAMIAAFDHTMRGASYGQQLALIRAHPNLAGRAAIAGILTDDSRREQAGAGLDSLTPEEFEHFAALNGRYLDTFGFPFIYAVRGATKHMILPAFAKRVENDRATEFATALDQIARIFRFRIEDRVAP